MLLRWRGSVPAQLIDLIDEFGRLTQPAPPVITPPVSTPAEHGSPMSGCSRRSSHDECKEHQPADEAPAPATPATSSATSQAAPSASSHEAPVAKPTAHPSSPPGLETSRQRDDDRADSYASRCVPKTELETAAEQRIEQMEKQLSAEVDRLVLDRDEQLRVLKDSVVSLD